MTASKSSISRRTTLGATGAAALLATAGPRPASAAMRNPEPYVDPIAVSYQPTPNTETCADCVHWDAAQCRAVAGADDPNGWCSAFTRTA